MGVAIAGGVGVPVLTYFLSPLFKRAEEEVNLTRLAPADDFRIEEPTSVSFTARIQDGWLVKAEDRAVWVVRTGPEDFWVYNPRCTHLGCAYSWNPERERFLCPCHAGVFTIDGTVVGGPPPRPLDRLDWQIEDGTLMVRYQDFAIGTPQKVPF